MIWSTAIGGGGAQVVVSIREVAGGFAVGGTSSNGSAGGYDFFLAHLSHEGDLLGMQFYGTAEWDLCSDMEVLVDGFILAGTTYVSGIAQGYLVRLDSQGDVLWEGQYDGGAGQRLNAVHVTSGGHLLVAGDKDSDIIPGDIDGWVASLDMSGGVEWIHTVVSDSLEYVSDVIELSDGRVACSGSTKAELSTWQMFLRVLTPEGLFEWAQNYGNTADFEASRLSERTDGGFAVSGYMSAFSAGGKDMILLLADANGGFELGKNYGGGGDDIGFDVLALPDGGFISAGQTFSHGPGSMAVYVVRGGPDGETSDDTVLETLDIAATMPDGREDVQFLVWPSIIGPGSILNLRLGQMSSDDVQAIILDAMGRAIRTFRVHSFEEVKVLLDVVSGAYTLVIFSNHSVSYSSRFIVTD